MAGKEKQSGFEKISTQQSGQLEVQGSTTTTQQKTVKTLEQSVTDLQALEYYRQRSRVEQHFDNLKHELDLNRLRIHDAQAMHVRVLIQFIALIVLQEARNTLARNTSMREYTVKEAIWRLASYPELTFSGSYGTVRSTPAKSQREIFELFGITHFLV